MHHQEEITFPYVLGYLISYGIFTTIFYFIFSLGLIKTITITLGAAILGKVIQRLLR